MQDKSIDIRHVGSVFLNSALCWTKIGKAVKILLCGIGFYFFCSVYLFLYSFYDFYNYPHQVLLTEYVGNRFLYFLSSRLYTEIFGIASVSSWFGIWKAVDFFTGSNVNITVAIVTISYIGLACTKTVRNVTGPPFAIITDKKQGYCDIPTLFQWSYHVSLPWKWTVCYRKENLLILRFSWFSFIYAVIYDRLC